MNDSALQQKRLIAAAIDIGVAFALALVLGIGSLVASFIIGAAAGRDSMLSAWVPRLVGFGTSLIYVVYIFGRDVFGGARSLGKKTQEIRVVTTAGAPIGLMDSVKRNAIFGIGSLLALLSSTLGLVPVIGVVLSCLLTPLIIIGALASLAAAVVELIKITQDPAGTRFGDQIAGTKVIQ